METLRLSNYKCFTDTGIFEFKPINILVGANSSGKSSFLEFLPLLKQSIGSRKYGALLWNNENGVDNQDFLNSVKDGKGDIYFSFRIRSKYIFDVLQTDFFEDFPLIQVNVVVGQKNIDKGYNTENIEIGNDYIKNLEIFCGGDKIELSYDNSICKNVKVNGETISVKGSPLSSDSGKGILPTFETEGVGFIRGSWITAAYNKVRDLLNNIKTIESDKQMSLIHKLNESPIDSSNQKNILETYNFSISEDDFKRIHNAVLYLNIDNIIGKINSYLQNFTDNLIYINPLRLEAHRNYILSNIATDSISPDGKNIPLYLVRLKQIKLLDDFNEWLEKFFNFTVDVNNTPSTIQVMIQEEGKSKRNITDVGCGYSQILPVILAVWDSVYINRDDETSKRIQKYPRFVVIEQPELHLHPRMQSQFAMMLSKTIALAREHKIDLRVLVETHSETIVNKIGLIIAEGGDITSDDVNVVLFNGIHEGMEDEVSFSSYDDNGYLTNWPYGFFDNAD